MAPTPYGDIADCLLSDVTAGVLGQYATVIAAGELRGGAELRDKLEAYVEGGGRLVITAANLAKFPSGLAGISVVGAGSHGGGRSSPCNAVRRRVTEDAEFELCALSAPAEAKTLAQCAWPRRWPSR